MLVDRKKQESQYVVSRAPHQENTYFGGVGRDIPPRYNMYPLVHSDSPAKFGRYLGTSKYIRKFEQKVQ